MENQSLISVIIPVYNVEAYLNECLDSVLSQSYRNFEIILIDDGSTDSSGDICREYEKKYPQISLYVRENSGLSASRNFGMEKAKGEYVYFLDSDDYITYDTFEKLISTAKKHNCDMVFFDAESFADPKGSFNVKQTYRRKYSYPEGEGYNLLELLQEKGVFHPSVPLIFFRKDFLSENNLRFYPGILHEDMVFTYQAFCVAKSVAQCNRAFYLRRYRKSSIMTSRKNELHFISCKKVYELSRDFSNEMGLTDRRPSAIHITRCAFNALGVYKKLDKDTRKKYKEEYLSLRADILENNAYQDTSLKMMCYGKVFWIVYKIFEKTIGRFFK